ncbi:hypothetical protein OAM79_04510 [Litorivicinus sp.]|nr:hypothetical protein [Litorivicinus sp.]
MKVGAQVTLAQISFRLYLVITRLNRGHYDQLALNEAQQNPNSKISNNEINQKIRYVMNTINTKLVLASAFSLLIAFNDQIVADEKMNDTVLKNCKDTSIDPAQRIVLKIRTGTTASPKELRCAEEFLNRLAVFDFDKNYFRNEIIDLDFRVDATRIFLDQANANMPDDSDQNKIATFSSINDSTNSDKDDLETVEGFRSIKSYK